MFILVKIYNRRAKAWIKRSVSIDDIAHLEESEKDDYPSSIPGDVGCCVIVTKSKDPLFSHHKYILILCTIEMVTKQINDVLAGRADH